MLECLLYIEVNGELIEIAGRVVGGFCRMMVGV